MKKSILLLVALCTTLLWGCVENVVEPPIVKPLKIEISATTTTYKVGEKGTFKVTSDNPTTSDLTIEVASDNAEVVSVPSSVTITKGTQEISTEFSTLKTGEATITLSSTNKNVTIEVKSITITVTEEGAPDVEVPETGTFIERLQGAKVFGRPAVASVKKITNGLPAQFEGGRYMVKFNQPLDHNNTSETFEQRVIVSIAANDKPVVFVTQGYGFGGGWSFEDPAYIEELVEILDCNQIIVEHRFFEESTPSIVDWKYHTLENQVNDLHCINLVMREIFKNQKFISTGRSKGGQTAIYYEASFPKDIDIAVPYVAPICYQLNDMRHAEFLKNVGGTAEASRRAKIKALQQELFNRRDKLVPMFKSQNNSTDFTVDMDIIFDLCVLEYSFMCWQYNPSGSIPDTKLSDSFLLQELANRSGASYFSPNDNAPFIMNVRHDIGYYGYDVAQFTNTVITQAQADRWIEDIVTPADAKNIEFDPAMGQKVKAFLQGNTTEKMIFIYGEYDTWSAAAVDNAYFAGKENMFRYDCPGMDHSTFISSFSSSIQKEIKDKIKAWLAE